MTLGKSESLTHETQVIFPCALWGFIILTNNKCTKTEKKTTQSSWQGES